MRPRFGSWVVLSACILALLLMLWAQLARADEVTRYDEAARPSRIELRLADQRFRQGNAVVGAVAVVVEDMLGRQ
jgi:hypothetical protein